MLNNATSLSRSGLRDWLIQRATAIILSAYFIFILVYLFRHPHLTYYEWHALFSNTWVKIFSVMALIAMVLHSWIGLWTISTDYFIARFQGSKAVYIRLAFQGFFALLLLIYLLFGVQILWGVSS
ncbi:MAG: succinate dehydrogenase, hydrophobic membrane anchor protein [Endozoicomonadaceae bacterium]|nr:succinate dehydrogenase, hydrophobic membrane anchor protein [Endozoicomonadaceae bacterium]